MWQVKIYVCTPLEVVDSCKYLGVTIQHDLRWSEHIHNITVKANLMLSFLRRNLKLNNQHLKETAYFSLVATTATRIRLCSLVTMAKNRCTKFREINRQATRFATSTYTIAPAVYPT